MLLRQYDIIFHKYQKADDENEVKNFQWTRYLSTTRDGTQVLVKFGINNLSY